MSFRRVTASTASSATASAMTMRAVRLGGRSASTPASGSELEIDEFMRLRRREYDQHEHEVGVGEGLSRPGAREDAVEALLALREDLEREQRDHVERDQPEHGHGDHRGLDRSEERRVGKGCRSRWAP